jgi:hypothetical protein
LKYQHADFKTEQASVKSSPDSESVKETSILKRQVSTFSFPSSIAGLHVKRKMRTVVWSANKIVYKYIKNITSAP